MGSETDRLVMRWIHRQIGRRVKRQTDILVKWLCRRVERYVAG